MSRHTDAVPPPVNVVNNNNMVSMIREYKLITPLLGGGASVKRPDSQTVVRASQIRGLLRFWWRAMRAGVCNGNVAALKEREALIWGGRVGTTMHPAAVKVVVRDAKVGTKVYSDADLIGGNPTPIHDVRSVFSYALFVLRDNTGAVDFELYKDSQFTLDISFPKNVRDIALDTEVGAALWAWEMFGGVGARSRRGVGAVQLLKVNGSQMEYPTAQKLPSHISEKLTYYGVQGNWSAGIPNLANARIGQYGGAGASIKIITAPQNHNTAVAVWQKLVKRYRDFRQERFMRPNANNPGQFRPFGSSVWPDANAIRTKYNVSRHGQSDYGEQAHAPRAQLGLPMVVQFMPNKFAAGNGSVQFIFDNAVGRHASPVIFRPVAVDGGGYVGLLLILGNSRIASTVNLKGNDSSTRRAFSGEHTVPVRGQLDIKDHGDNQGAARNPHGPTNTADVLAGLFNFMN